MKKAKIETLNPTDSQKSFYGKARVITFPNGDRILQSYETYMAKITKEGKIVRLTDAWSQTTGRHIARFAE